jgi:hypothetical protein
MAKTTKQSLDQLRNTNLKNYKHIKRKDSMLDDLGRFMKNKVDDEKKK